MNETEPERASDDPREPADAPAPEASSPPPEPEAPRRVLRGRIPVEPPPPPRRGLLGGMGCGLAIGLALVVGAILAFCLLLAALGAAGGAAGGGGQVQLFERTVEGAGDAKIALIAVEGPIMPYAVPEGQGLFGVPIDLVATFKAQLDKAADDPEVKAVLLHIDSPGGAVTTSDQLWHHLGAFRKRTGKKVVVHMGAVCASGGYYLAANADKIACEPTTITGSIGVILTTLNFHDLLSEHGVKDVTIASGDNKALLNPFGPVEDSHRQILKGMVDEMYARFTQIVADGRQLPLEDVRKLADGRIYTADQALKLKLVDQIGYREDSLALARQLAGVTQARLVEYTGPPSLADVLAGQARGGPTLSIDPRLLEELRTPRLMAIWRP